MKKNHRREFLKRSFLGLSGITLMPGSMKIIGASTDVQDQIPELPIRTLGGTGIRTPLVSLGAGSSNNPNFVKSAYYAGIKLFFSATYYGEGNNERLVGDGLKGLPRESFVIGTAAPPDEMDTRTGSLPAQFDAEAYVRKASVSLNRFGLGYVDIFMLPYAAKKDVILREPLLRALQDIRKKGITKFLGIASHGNIEEALRAAADSKVYDVAMIAYNYKSGNKEALHEAINYAVKAGVGVVAMKTMAGGSRSGSEVNSDSVLKWVLQNENISSIVSGMSSVEELEKNLAMIKNLKMTEQELKSLGLASNNQDLYCHQCRRCVTQCPYKLEIPTAMRSYMYAYGYRNFEYAQHTFLSAGLPDNACNNCIECSVKCTAGFNLKERIGDISRLKIVPREFLV